MNRPITPGEAPEAPTLPAPPSQRSSTVSAPVVKTKSERVRERPQAKAVSKTKPATGKDDPRNAEYIAARNQLGDNATKAERDKVRDLGIKINKELFN